MTIQLSLRLWVEYTKRLVVLLADVSQRSVNRRQVKDRTSTLEAALGLIPDGALLGIGGALLKRKPVRFLSALAAAGRRDLRVVSFLASLDAELLAAYGCLTELHCGYVGFEQLGFAPAVTAATDAGTIRRVDYSEIMFVSGLRASLAGLPFLPTRAGVGSQVAADAGIRTVTCPYTGEQLMAAPALRPDVSVLHAAAADREGNILGPVQADFLFDMDANLARASRHVIVTVEELVDGAELRAANRRTLLCGFEVDAVVVLPDGARPTALPGNYSAAVNVVSRYLETAGHNRTQAAGAMDQLVSR
jgi:glutaconate CoA-transferase subunit A